MNLTGLFIRRPVMTALVMIGIILFGIAGYRNLPVSDLPNIDFPTLQVSATLPGANPDTMASSVATPLERQFATVPGIDTMTSTSSIGSTNITIQFTLERDIDAAGQAEHGVGDALRDATTILRGYPSRDRVPQHTGRDGCRPAAERSHTLRAWVQLKRWKSFSSSSTRVIARGPWA